jgi:glycosyltransferase involved in cell wall biosynthesis
MAGFSSKVTFVIFTYNEELRIDRAIRNFIKYGKVLVVDNFSSDSTVEIAKKYNCDILMNKNPGWVEDEITTGRVFDAISTEWIYWAYADELIERKSLENIISIIDRDQHDIISITRKNYYYGRFCYDAFSDRLNRVFRVGAIDFTGNKIHEFGKRLVADSRVYTLPSDLFVHHFISNTATSYLRVMDKYTDIQAEREVKYKSPPVLMVSSIRCFLEHYLLRSAYKAGISGFSLVINMIYYSWLLNMKKYEVDNHIELNSIELSNNRRRDEILEQIGED